VAKTRNSSPLFYGGVNLSETKNFIIRFHHSLQPSLHAEKTRKNHSSKTTNMFNTNINPALFVTMAISNWDLQNERLQKLLETLTDDQLTAHTAPGRNTGTYLIGHLAAVHDAMLPLLGFREKLYPALKDPFIDLAENTSMIYPSLPELKSSLKEVTATLKQYFDCLPADAWFSRHTAITEEQFGKEPHRNKLNILLNRTNHLSYHFGQLAYLQGRN
jgi:hypothetical protein